MGYVLKNHSEGYKKIPKRIFIYGFFLMCLGLSLNYTDLIPFNKNIWYAFKIIIFIYN